MPASGTAAATVPVYRRAGMLTRLDAQPLPRGKARSHGGPASRARTAQGQVHEGQVLAAARHAADSGAGPSRTAATPPLNGTGVSPRYGARLPPLRPSKSHPPKVAAYLAESQFYERVDKALAQVLEAGTPWPDDPVAAVAARLLPPKKNTGATKGSWWDLILHPPQQKLELTETNQYSWPGATERQERCFYCATWNLLHDRGLGEVLCSALRTHASDRFPLYLGGNVPLNYYLMERFGAPAPIPSNDIDVKVDIGDYLRSLLRARGGADMPASHSDVGDHKTPNVKERTDDEKELFRACKQETIALFVEHAATLMAEMAAATKRMLPQIERELAQHGFKLGRGGVHIHHKTHTAAREGKPPFHIVPVSGGVFQLMMELTYAGNAFLWNIVDLEADWKLAGPCGKPAPCEVVAADSALPVRDLKLLAPTALRADLEHKFQPNKEQRRAYKREYWDWAVARHAEQHPAGGGLGKNELRA